MKENSYVAGSVDVDRGGVRARQDTKVDDALFSWRGRTGASATPS